MSTNIAKLFDVLLKNLVKLLTRIFPNIHPNYYTVARLILTLPTLLLLYWQYNYWALILFIFGGFLDILDGPIARYQKLTSRTGAFLDPLADKILFLSVMCLYYDQIFEILFFALLTIEILLLVEHVIKFCYLINKTPETRKEGQKSHLSGKIKFWFEMIGCGLLIINLLNVANSILLIALIFAAVSFINHLTIYFEKKTA